MPYCDVSRTVLVHWVTNAAAVHGGLSLVLTAMLLLAERGATLMLLTKVGNTKENLNTGNWKHSSDAAKNSDKS